LPLTVSTTGAFVLDIRFMTAAVFRLKWLSDWTSRARFSMVSSGTKLNAD
jgi:hypothetical protein